MRKGGHSLPSGWVLKPIRRLVDVRLSNVDKKTVRGQDPVRLCNYTDVYYGSFITDSTEFMSATASDDQRRRFLLQPGDVLITKDSESNEDIARPAVVAEELDSVVCGYHLALLRPHSIDGRFLYWALASAPVNDQFTRRANGVTRFGLTSQAIKSVVIPVPPVPDQCRIDRFLTARTKQIDEAIAAKKRLVQLLEEERQVVIADAVLGRLTSPNGLVASPLAWAPTLPAPWDLRRIKVVLNERSHKGYPDLPLLAATQSKGVIRKEDYETRTVVAQKDLHLLKLVEVGDFVISLRSFQGGIERAHHRGIISPAYTVLYARDPEVQDFLTYLFKSRPFLELLRLNVTGIREGQNIDYSRLGRELIPIPPTEEQARIVRYLDDATARLSASITIAERQIALLEEYRAALIADAVTGKLDLSAADSRQLDTVAEEAVEAALAGEPA